MPITFKTSDVKTGTWRMESTPHTCLCPVINRIKSPSALLQYSSPADFKQCKSILKSSNLENGLREKVMASSANGFVYSIYHAYSHHYHLTIRPEDVWFGILTQLSFYINKNADDLQDKFVDFKDKQKLELQTQLPSHQIDFAKGSQWFADLIDCKLNQPGLKSWFMPNFSTTTSDDKTIASIIVMGTFQNCMRYSLLATCGIPSVTLLGERSDWILLQNKLDDFPELGDEPKKFAQLLKPILKKFVSSFTYPQDKDIHAFWNSSVQSKAYDCASEGICGWLTAFCFWNHDGTMLWSEPVRSRKRHDDANKQDDYIRALCDCCRALFGPQLEVEEEEYELVSARFGPNTQPLYVLDGVAYHQIDVSEIPSAIVSVPLTLVVAGVNHETRLIAGSMGIQAKYTVDGVTIEGYDREAKNKLDSIRPFACWMIYEEKEDGSA